MWAEKARAALIRSTCWFYIPAWSYEWCHGTGNFLQLSQGKTMSLWSSLNPAGPIVCLTTHLSLKFILFINSSFLFSISVQDKLTLWLLFEKFSTSCQVIITQNENIWSCLYSRVNRSGTNSNVEPGRFTTLTCNSWDTSWLSYNLT